MNNECGRYRSFLVNHRRYAAIAGVELRLGALLSWRGPDGSRIGDGLEVRVNMKNGCWLFLGAKKGYRRRDPRGTARYGHVRLSVWKVAFRSTQKEYDQHVILQVYWELA